MNLTSFPLLRSLLFVSAVTLGCVQATAAEQIPIETEIVAFGMGQVLEVAFAPGDRNRLYIAELEGSLWLMKDEVRLPIPFLDITSLTTASGEQGFLGVAFHPDYVNNGWFFVSYTNLAGDTRVDRFTVSLNPDLADFASRVNILSIAQPFTNHNGGCIRFGPDGFLYVGVGDGGAAGDPGNRAQDGLSLLGKMLRIDIENGLPYTIPASNPFVGDPSTLDEIWALGLRNPWRFTFDRETGDLFIADVGQAEWEYIYFQAAGDPGGHNYGWRITEGSHCFNPQVGCNTAGLTNPIYEYGHTLSPFRCSIIGAAMYRGRSMANMSGRFFFSDTCSIELWSFRYDSVGGVQDFTEHTVESGVSGAGRSIGTDHDGEVYICFGRTLRKIVPAGMYLKVPHLFTGVADTIVVERCNPNATVFLAYSMSGVGMFPVGQLGVTVLLDNPALAATTASDSAGVASFPIVLPGSLFGRTLWLEAVQNGQVSNVTMEVVE